MFHLYRSERADALVDALGRVLASSPTDPFAPEVIAVPTKGIERWLQHRLATVLGASAGGRDGVCANVEFPFPGRLVADAVSSAVGREPEADPWRAERLVWPLIDIFEANQHDEWLAHLARHLGAYDDPGDRNTANRRARRFGVLRHVADLFDRYATHRPEMIRAWNRGELVGADGRPLDGTRRWQAQLWQQLRAHLATPSPPEILADACDTLRTNRDCVGLPDRLSVFGMTRLPASHLDVLRALGEQREVHFLALHPSPVLWDRIAPITPVTPGLRAADRTPEIAQHPMLRTWARDSREMQLVLTEVGDDSVHLPLDLPEPSTLLGQLQDDIRNDRAPDPTGRVFDLDDRSIEIHRCHGRRRQVDAIRDSILHRLADDPSLEPRDVIVMCPDIEADAPLIRASFGVDIDLDERDDAGRPIVPIRLADRALRQTNPVLGTIAAVVALADARITVSELLDFAGRPPVARRFGFDDDALARITEWIDGTGIRWGLDADRRHRFSLDKVPTGTWRAGLDRLLLGVAMSDDGAPLVDGVLPLDDVASGDVGLAGRLAELIDRLDHITSRLAEKQPLTVWIDALREAADLLCSVGPVDGWQRGQFDRILDELEQEATGSKAVLELGEVRSMVDHRLAGQPARTNFRTGHVTLCTLVPMRSVPHRVVCLLGLDDERFPRVLPRDGDDILRRSPMVGDRDERGEDRQLLLDALLSATEALVVSYQANDAHTNVKTPPSVPVSELLDVVDHTTTSPDELAVSEHISITHPLRADDVRNFVPAAVAIRRNEPWSFDPAQRAAAMAGREPHPPAPFLDGCLAPVDTTVISLDSLVAAAVAPVKTFLRERLELTEFEPEASVRDMLTLEHDNLGTWQIGDRILGRRLAGVDRDRALDAERATGLLAPGHLAEQALATASSIADQIVERVQQLDGMVPASSIAIDIELADGTRVTGTVPDVADGRQRSVTYSRVAAKQRVTTWVRHVALNAQSPGTHSSVTIGKGAKGRISTFSLPPLSEGDARRELESLVDRYRRVLASPVPCPVKTAFSYVRWGAGRASGEWASGWNSNFGAWADNEDAESDHVLVWGPSFAYDDLLAIPPLADESGPGWFDDEAGRLGRMARRLWTPILAVEKEQR